MIQDEPLPLDKRHLVHTAAISVVICAYTEERWNDLRAAVASVQAQILPAREIVIVIDHNPELLELARKELAGTIIVPNTEKRGLSGARNCGIATSTGEIIAFLDEDAFATSDWLMRLTGMFADPQVIGTGGRVEPYWLSQRPNWFPDEFNWVVGCSYQGMPVEIAPIRNPIGANMAFRREVFAAVGGFRDGIGRVGKVPVGCEETELCIRAHQSFPDKHILYDPQAVVHHRVPDWRMTWKYFRSRCSAEGRSKALVAHYVGANAGLSSERTYTFRTLPTGVLRGLSDVIRRGDFGGLGRAAAIIAGLGITTAGYLQGAYMQQAYSRKATTTKREDNNNGHEARIMTAPILIREVELSTPLEAIADCHSASGHPYKQALIIVRLFSQPLGTLIVPLVAGRLSSDNLADHIWQRFSLEIQAFQKAQHIPQACSLTADGLPSLEQTHNVRDRKQFLSRAPFVSVVVATRDRPEYLRPCLDALLAQDYPGYEIIIVDNAPRTNHTWQLVKEHYGDDDRVRYVREDKPGLSRARNRGLAEVRHDFIAFTDDDVRVDTYWLAELIKGFEASSDVACVTGATLPVELETEAQVLFEQFGGFSRGGFERRIVDRAEHRPHHPLFPYSPVLFGSGNNMAFTCSFLRSIGGFDIALGAGSLTQGGEDLAAFSQVILRNHQLIYEPAALNYHLHRRDYAGLQRQVFGYGAGLTAYLTKMILDEPWRLLEIGLRIPAGIRYMLNPVSQKNARKDATFPVDLKRSELRGLVEGPLGYVRGRLS
jgi:O-antigen biosynthesis protein